LIDKIKGLNPVFSFHIILNALIFAISKKKSLPISKIN
tara:strand:- start:649 stop:762 length:114 start_codon:yes stop_codon:yes gene_type:complete